MLQIERNLLFLKVNHLMVVGFVLLTLVFDFIDKIEIFYEWDFPKFNRYLKVIVILYSILFIVICAKNIFRNLKFLIYAIIGLSLLFAIKYAHWHLYLQEFYRYIFIFFFLPVLHFSAKYGERQKLFDTFYFLFKTFMVANLIAIIIGFSFEVYIFRTYQFQRFGYNGFILSQGLTPYLYLSALIIFWAKRNFILISMVLLSSLFSGIKGVYFGELLLLIFLVLLNDKYSRTNKAKAILIGGIIFGIILLITLLSPPLSDVIKEEGVLSALFSFRNDNLMEIANNLNKRNFSLLIGVMGIDAGRVELQLFDVLLFFGLLGLTIYTYLMIVVYKRFASNTNAKAFFLSSLLLSFVSGNLFYIPLSITLFFLVLLILHFQKSGS